MPLDSSTDNLASAYSTTLPVIRSPTLCRDTMESHKSCSAPCAIPGTDTCLGGRMTDPLSIPSIIRSSPDWKVCLGCQGHLTKSPLYDVSKCFAQLVSCLRYGRRQTEGDFKGPE